MAAKATAVTAAGGLVFALLLPGELATATASDVSLPDRDDHILIESTAMAALGDRGDGRASRSAARPTVALQAPTTAGALAAPAFGELSVTAVEKPPPPPPPAVTTAGSAGSVLASSGGGSAPAQASGGAYDWAAANACSCARGLTQNSMRVLAAVKASFPGMTNIGGVRPDSLPDHPSGRALDFMTTDRGYGDAIVNLLISRSGELNIEYIIWYQRIWLPGQGWRHMSNRGSATANHMDHVHVTVR